MTQLDIEKYKKLGWKFKSDSWTSPHNGDIDDELLAKSPRVKNFFCVVSSKGHVPTWDEVSEDKLVDAEYKAYIRESVEHIKNHYKYKLDGIIEEALKQGREEVVIKISNLT